MNIAYFIPIKIIKMKIFSKFITIGVSEENDDNNKLIILSNQFTLLVILLTFFYGIFQQFLFQESIKAYLSFVSIPLFFVVTLLNYFSKTTSSRIFISLYMPVPVLLASILPKIYQESNNISFVEFVDIRFFLLGFMVVPLLLFDLKTEKRELLLSLGIYLILLMFYDAIHNLLGIGIDSFIIDKHNYLILQLSPIICAVLIIGSFIFLKSINDKFEMKVKESNFSLQQQKEEILTQNEELRQSQEEIQTQRDFVEVQNKKLQENEKILKKIYEQMKVNNANLLQANNRINLSIKSAKDIQNALLPTQEKLRRTLGDYFLIYKSKDIVSGDFYWTTSQDQYIFLVASDCTGHGVPGALMANMGMTFLYSIIKEKKIFRPAQILEALHHEISVSLKQEQTGNNNGMDVSILRIERNNTINEVNIMFAGAKQDIIIFESEKNLIQELRSCFKTPIIDKSTHLS